MDYDYFLERFQKAADQLDKKMLIQKHLEIYVGVTLNSVVLKLYKKAWSNDKADPINAKTRIFFAIWVNDQTLKHNKVFYNIHALKLRQLKGYSIASSEFADSFRSDLKKHEKHWENVSVKLGPLTLMEGWNYFENENLENTIIKLANNFLEIEYIIDHTLEKFKSRKVIH
ncbi:MAG: hypothetical protein KDD16_10840 [Mangrovimonas sp.]|nr:hypothetical protein [Mangrovimonas sp.]